MIRKHFSARRSVVAIAAAASLIVSAAPAVSASPLDGLAAFGAAGSVEAGVIDDAAIAALLQQPGVDQMKVRELAEDPETTPDDFRDFFGKLGIDIEKFIADFEAFIAEVRAFFEEIFGQTPGDPAEPVDPILAEGEMPGLDHSRAYQVRCAGADHATVFIEAEIKNSGFHRVVVERIVEGKGYPQEQFAEEKTKGEEVLVLVAVNKVMGVKVHSTFVDATGATRNRTYELDPHECTQMSPGQ